MIMLRRPRTSAHERLPLYTRTYAQNVFIIIIIIIGKYTRACFSFIVYWSSCVLGLYWLCALTEAAL